MEQKIVAVVAGREIKEADFEKFLQNVPREQQAYLSNPQFDSNVWINLWHCICLQNSVVR